jgi:hypothetical protein
MNSHVLLGATGERAISALGPDGGSCHGAYSLFDLDCCTHSTIYQQAAGRTRVSIVFNLPARMSCLRSGTEDGRH